MVQRFVTGLVLGPRERREAERQDNRIAGRRLVQQAREQPSQEKHGRADGCQKFVHRVRMCRPRFQSGVSVDEPTARHLAGHADSTAAVSTPEDGAAIVGIGASAGGLDAFTRLLRRLPPDTGCAFVLVQHLEASHPSSLSELLGRATTMPVAEASDGLPVAPNRIYVIPPNRELTIAGRVLRLAPRPPWGLHRPIEKTPGAIWLGGRDSRPFATSLRVAMRLERPRSHRERPTVERVWPGVRPRRLPDARRQFARGATWMESCRTTTGDVRPPRTLHSQ
jgi:hypothetical protein